MTSIESAQIVVFVIVISIIANIVVGILQFLVFAIWYWLPTPTVRQKYKFYRLCLGVSLIGLLFSFLPIKISPWLGIAQFFICLFLCLFFATKKQTCELIIALASKPVYYSQVNWRRDGF